MEIAVNALPDNLTSEPWAGIASHVALTGLGSQLAGYDTSSLPDNGCEKPPSGANITGRLAKSISLSPNGKTVTIVVRPLKSAWGHTLSATDVEWSLERDMKEDSVVLDNLQQAGYDVKHLVTVVNPTTVELHVLKGSSYTLETLANNILNIYDSTEVMAHATAKDPLGNNWLQTHVADYSGWALQSFVPGSSMTLTAVPNWGLPRGNVIKLVLEAVTSPATREEVLSSGQVDAANGFEYSQYRTLAGDAGVKLINCASYTGDTMALQTNTEPFTSPLVRQAVSLAVNRKALLEGAYGDFGSVSETPYSTAFGFTPMSTYSYNPTEAKQLLSKAGYPHGFSMTLTYSPTRPGPVVNQSAILIQSELAAVGITVALKQVAGASQFYAAWSKGQYQAALYSEPAALTDASFQGYVSFGSTAPDNSTGFKDPAYDTLNDQLQHTPLSDTAKRKELIAKLAQVALDSYSTLYLVQPPNLYAVRSDVANATPYPDGQFLFTDLSKG